ncbi:MAG: heparinase II/III domain-containing protein, partial [Armatimonadota bacterium]
HKNWMWSTRSVNSITVGGQDQIRHSAAAKGEIVAFDTNDEFDYVAGECGGAYPDGLVDQFTRHILFAKPDLIIILDELETPEPQTFDWWLHSMNEMRIDGQHDITIESGDVRCSVNMLAPEGLEVSQTNKFDPPPRERIKLTQWHTTASTQEPATRMRFVTLLRPHRVGDAPPTGGEVELTDDACAVRAEVDGGEVIALWRLGDTDVSGMGLSTDGDVAVMRVSDTGEPGAGMVHGGTRVDYEGRP